MRCWAAATADRGSDDAVLLTLLRLGLRRGEVPLEGSRGDRVLVPTTITRTALHHYQGRKLYFYRRTCPADLSGRVEIAVNELRLRGLSSYRIRSPEV
jgi:hypothetical protein